MSEMKLKPCPFKHLHNCVIEQKNTIVDGNVVRCFIHTDWIKYDDWQSRPEAKPARVDWDKFKEIAFDNNEIIYAVDELEERVSEWLLTDPNEE